jgi:alanine racemase
VNSNTLTRVEIDLSAIRHNIAAIKGFLARHNANPPGILAVVKSDAYGHGMKEVSQAISNLVWGLAVFDIDEAITLRALGISCPIVLISGMSVENAEAVCAHNLTPGITHIQALNALEAACARQNRTCTVHLKVDTGMSRMGLTRTALLKILQAYITNSWPHLRITGIFSHLCCADEPEHPMNRLQIQAFEAIRESVLSLGISNIRFHLANSAGILHLPQTHYDLVRPGLAIYGGYCNEQARALINLLPAMNFKSKVVEVRTVNKGDAVSYGATYVAQGHEHIAVIPVGYDNGYLRSLSNKAQVLIQGQRAPVVGRICMRSLMVNVTHLSQRMPEGLMGQEVVLLGRQGNDAITWEEMAKWAGTINYELMCSIGAKNFRVFCHGKPSEAIP